MASKFIDDGEDARRMQRIADMVEEPRKMLMPIKGYEKVPLVTLEEAVQPLVSFVDDVRRMAFIAKQKCENPADDLTCDESASIMLYSMEWEPHDKCLYFVFNATLRAAHRRNLAAWFLFLRLILTALGKLPSTSLTVYRGIKLDLSKDYTKNKTFVWWGFSSCTGAVEVLNSEQFLGKNGDRTLFNITCYSGKSIRNHSYFEREDEILLLPVRLFKVTSTLNPAEGLHIIQMVEIEPEFPLLEPVPSITYYMVPLSKALPKNNPALETKNVTPKIKCRYGGECWNIDDKIHCQTFDHPPYCLQEGSCTEMDPDHLKQFRHLPLCIDGQKCVLYLKRDAHHCKLYRHCQRMCPYGNQCVQFHDKDHVTDLKHPFPTPCPRTPFHCLYYTDLSEATNAQTVNKEVQQHCLTFAHVCRFGRNCKDNSALHQEKFIHIIRRLCPYDSKCKKLHQDEHLNSYAHTNIADIRRVCQYADKCHELHKLDHTTRFRHARSKEDISVVYLYGLNNGLNFVQNQCEIIKRVLDYVQKQGWKPLPSDTVPREILDYFRTVQPVHRCSPFIFESILLHGHVMSRNYMENLNKVKFVTISVMQHAQIGRIENIRIPEYTRLATDYIAAIVNAEFDAANFPSDAEHAKNIKSKEKLLASTFSTADIEVMKTKAKEIAQASIKLNSNPAGIGHAPDKTLGTHKRVFSILGPHLGHYFGDVILVFKREILHHPDADFSMCAATTFGTSQHAYSWRPWLTDPGTSEERINHYHHTKFHASVPGVEYAIALELMAMTCLELKTKSMDIDLQTIFQRWFQIDSHKSIEAHLPQLIPIDYIDHIYLPQNVYDKFNDQTRRALDAVFKNHYTLIKHKGCVDDNAKGSAGPKPADPERAAYQKEVVDALMKRYDHDINYAPSRPVKGAVITIPASNFTESFVLPLTISQAYELYQFENRKKPSDNIAYIYWQAINGDMMLVLSKEPLEVKEDKPATGHCLLCYIAPKSDPNDYTYHEKATYINIGQPIEHHKFTHNNQFRAKSNTFHMGSNTDDYITYCLELHRSKRKVILRQVGANGIYNHEEISYDFGKSELDLSQLEFIHVTANTKEASIRNLFVSFEKESDLECTADSTNKNPY